MKMNTLLINIIMLNVEINISLLKIIILHVDMIFIACRGKSVSPSISTYISEQPFNVKIHLNLFDNIYKDFLLLLS